MKKPRLVRGFFLASSLPVARRPTPDARSRQPEFIANIQEKVMRVLTKESEIGRYTQGSIFAGLRAADGSGRNGIVITARCDIAHKKSKSIICLPIYRLEDWLILRGNEEIAEQSETAIKNMASEILNKYNINSRAIEIYGIDRTFEILDSYGIKRDDRIKLQTLCPFLTNRDPNSKIKLLTENRKKLIESIIKNNRTETFFLERIHPGGEAIGYVIDLAEPTCVSQKALEELSKGLEYAKYNRNSEDDYRNIIVKKGEQARIFSNLQSPYIELLLQRFSAFYSRIGTPDITKSDLEQVRRLHEIN